MVLSANVKVVLPGGVDPPYPLRKSGVLANVDDGSIAAAASGYCDYG